MPFNYKRFIELKKYSQELKLKGKLLDNENREAFFELLNYQVEIQDNLFFREKISFISIINDFISNYIEIEEYMEKLFGLSQKTKTFQETLEKNFEKLENFHPTFKSKGFSKLIQHLLSDCELYESTLADDIKYDSIWVKNCAKSILLEIKKYS